MYGYNIFHENIMENLIESIRHKTARHAYIFEGEKGVGTYEAAQLFAAAMVCENTQSAPCGTCPACIMAAAGTHPDIYFVKPPDGKKNISVDMVRGIVTDAYTKPYESRKKVYIIAYGCCTSDEISILTFNISPPYFIVIYIIKVGRYFVSSKTVSGRI